MGPIETDYLVVGAGATGMAFTDTLIAHSDAEVVLVDRRHRPGGHWNDAYPFVRLHQPSANYGVESRTLGFDRIDESGPNAGFYERATAGEICDYYNRVLDETFLPSGRVRFFGMADYAGNGEHRITSNVTGETIEVKVRRKLVDATHMETTTPLHHTPSFEVDDGVRVIPPHHLVGLSGPVSGFTVMGAGKTSMDTVCWLIDQRVDPDHIRWIRPRDSWTFDRAQNQPLEKVAGILSFQAGFVEAAGECTDAADLMRRMGEKRVLRPMDPDHEPQLFRGAILSGHELETVRRVRNVVRLGKVRTISSDAVVLDEGEIGSDPDQLYIDCTAHGLSSKEPTIVFEADRVTPQTVTLGIIPWSAATVGFIEAVRDDDDEKNRLAPPLRMPDTIEDMLLNFATGITSFNARLGEADIAGWNETCRLNPAGGAMDKMDDPEIAEAFGRLLAAMGPALENLTKIGAA